eukprot:762134-Hanusia_phi.AAC.1
MKQLCRKLGVGRWPYQKQPHKGIIYQISQPNEDRTAVFSTDDNLDRPCPAVADDSANQSFPDETAALALSSLPSWGSEATSETWSDIFDMESSYDSELENELESLLQPGTSIIDPPFQPLM